MGLAAATAPKAIAQDPNTECDYKPEDLEKCVQPSVLFLLAFEPETNGTGHRTGGEKMVGRLGCCRAHYIPVLRQANALYPKTRYRITTRLA